MYRSAILIAIALALPLAGCGDSASRGLVITGDGKVGANNARNQRESAQDTLRIAMEEDLGKGWSIRVAIDELPIWLEERAIDDGFWRWEHLTCLITITPPVGQALSEAKRQDLLDGSRKYLTGKLTIKKDPTRLNLSMQTAEAVPVVAAAPPVAQMAGGKTYEVQPGDTLADISMAFYGSTRYWRLLVEANPNGTEAGRTIIIPAKPDASIPTVPAQTAPAPQ